MLTVDYGDSLEIEDLHFWGQYPEELAWQVAREQSQQHFLVTLSREDGIEIAWWEAGEEHIPHYVQHLP